DARVVVTVRAVAMQTFLSFFFSSRRRHTRWPRDWSSDVVLFRSGCKSPSSDTTSWSGAAGSGRIGNLRLESPSGGRWPVRPLKRSEERRVGKECRSRWSRYEEKRKREETMRAETCT